MGVSLPDDASHRHVIVDLKVAHTIVVRSCCLSSPLIRCSIDISKVYMYCDVVTNSARLPFRREKFFGGGNSLVAGAPQKLQTDRLSTILMLQGRDRDRK